MRIVHLVALLMMGVLMSGFSTTAQAAGAALSSQARAILDKSSGFRSVATFKELPAAIQESLGDMADPGDKWTVDCSGEEGVPHKRLIWAMTDGADTLVYYESGGRVYLRLVLIATVDPVTHKAIRVWHGRADPKTAPIENTADVMRALSAGQLVHIVEKQQ